ncbi:tRNA (uracil-5-)-methyltransferase homolog A [Aplysia californica]|uniref:tRNA (uracil(54)-C(5))-methyltransferase n=1 Tax=Aplysia californica TaxID=6500 RepID=A0ABM1VWJ3_APLCA|nr:tRNA (uracil-5-)-methyltransferase homolog A [Aplysia californica]XP_035826785.1 tRNA (uracil-5-)-methyltransferase homolog A [Aplysia californica]
MDVIEGGQCSGQKRKLNEQDEENDEGVKRQREDVQLSSDQPVIVNEKEDTGGIETTAVAEDKEEDCCDKLPSDDVCRENDSADAESKKLLDPLSYTQGEEFTSEIYKIQIHNLPKFGFSQLKKRLKSTLGLNPHKIKSPNKQFVTYVCFRNESDRSEALAKINGHVWKGKTLEAKIAAPVADPYLQKHHGDKGRPQGGDCKSSSDQTTPVEKLTLTPEEAEERLKASVTPLWNTEYPEQLRMKTEKIREVLKKVTRHHFVRHMFKSDSQLDGMACPLDPVVPSPITSEYRNKNEFTIGYGLDGKTITVGFRYGLYKDGTTSVGDCTNLKVVMPAALPVVQSFSRFVASSKWQPFHQQTNSGHWQTLTVRTYRSGDVLAMVDFVPRKLGQEDVDEAKSAVQRYFTTGEGKDVKITSFYFRTVGGKGQNGNKKTQVLFGEKHVYEHLMGLKFRISPEAFFQVNTLATEKLYELIGEWSGVGSNTTVLDVCCGTGTIALSLAKKVKAVIGIEMCREATDDAKVNASINGITNSIFHCARVEDIIATTMSSLPSRDDVVAVVDPPRAGLHKNVIKTLRKSYGIQRLVYVSCNPESAMENFVDLIRPATGKLKGRPFMMVKAVPVDLFPGTKHCELVILFQREKQEDGESNKEESTTVKDGDSGCVQEICAKDDGSPHHREKEKDEQEEKERGEQGEKDEDEEQGEKDEDEKQGEKERDEK